MMTETGGEMKEDGMDESRRGGGEEGERSQGLSLFLHVLPAPRLPAPGCLALRPAVPEPPASFLSYLQLRQLLDVKAGVRRGRPAAERAACLVRLLVQLVEEGLDGRPVIDVHFVLMV
jgi:hypothetical protein